MSSRQWNRTRMMERIVIASLCWPLSFAFLSSDTMHGVVRSSISAFSSSSALKHPTHHVTQTRQQMLTETLPLQRTDAVPLSRSNSSLGRNVLPREIAQLSHPLAAGAVIVQTLLVQPMMKEIGYVLQCSLDKTAICFPTLSPTAIEAKVFSTMGHLALDAVALAGAPSSMSAMGFRVISVLGHLCSTTAFQVQEAGVTAPEECLFQLATLYLAFSNLFKHLSHHVVSQMLSGGPTSRNHRAFKLLFEPTGMNLYQYNTLSSFTTDWVTLQEGDEIQSSSEALYWLYKGSVHVQNHDSQSSYELQANPITRNWSAKVHTGLLGDLDFLRQLESPSSSSTSASFTGGLSSFQQEILNQFGCASTNPEEEQQEEECDLEPAIDSKGESWTVGPGGATLLRMDTKAALSLLHDYDESLEKPLRKLVLQGLQSKLNRSLSQS